jgi:hypothetical protein
MILMFPVIAILKYLLIAFLIVVGLLLICWGFVLLVCGIWDSLKSRGRIPLFLLRRRKALGESGGSPKRDIPEQLYELKRSGRGYSLSSITIAEEAFGEYSERARNRVIEGVALGVIPGTIRSRDRTAQSGHSRFSILYPGVGIEGATVAVSRVERRIADYLERNGVQAPAKRFIDTEITVFPGRLDGRRDDRHLRDQASPE